MKKIFITGICGFLGSALALALRESVPGLEIFGLDNFIRPGSESNRARLQQRDIKVFHGDIRCASDYETLPEAQWVIDAAANPSVLAGVDGRTSSQQLVEHNLIGTLHMLEYCKRHSAGFTLISTSRVYSVGPLSCINVLPVEGAFQLASDKELPQGVSPAGIDETFSTVPPVSLYGSTKLASETLALEYGETFGFPVWINRCGVLAGAGQFGKPDQGIFSFWLHSWLSKRSLAYIGFGGKGYQVRDALHPRDLIPLMRKQFDDSKVQERIVNLGGGMANSMSLAQLSGWCQDRWGPLEVVESRTERPFDLPWVVMDCARAREVWDWEPETSLGEILNEIASHAEQNPHWLELSGVM